MMDDLDIQRYMLQPCRRLSHIEQKEIARTKKDFEPGFEAGLMRHYQWMCLVMQLAQMFSSKLKSR